MKSDFEVVEAVEPVNVPGVGPLERVVLRTPDGEVLAVSYRRPPAAKAEGVTTGLRPADGRRITV